jgi:hypothetical protein
LVGDKLQGDDINISVGRGELLLAAQREKGLNVPLTIQRRNVR